MHKKFRFSKATRVLIVAATAVSISGIPQTALACTQVYVGSELTTTGDTFWGRAEDYANRYPKAFGIAPATKNGKVIQSYENDIDPKASFSYKIDGPTFRYTFVRDTPDNWTEAGDVGAKAYSEAGTNEKGVSVSATLTTNMNEAIDKVDPRIDTGIGEYSINDFVLSQASTAREGVELLGKVIDEQGSQDCNQIVIGDANETWIFTQLSGKQWIAVKMAADQASVNPNMDNLKFDVDLEDSKNCLHSKDLKKVAEDAGTYVEKDGKMDVAGSYGSSSEDQGVGQNTRYVQGHLFFGEQLVEGTDYTVDKDGAVATVANSTFYVKPAEKVDTFTALRSLGARGEGTAVDANKNDKLYSIGNNRNTESHIFQVRKGLDADIATIQWEGLSRSEFTLYIPSYSALLTEVDQDIYPNEVTYDTSHVGENMEYSKDKDGNRVDDKTKAESNEKLAMEDSGKKYLDYDLMDLNTLAYNHRKDVAEGVHAYLDVLQKDIIAQHETVDVQMKDVKDSKARMAFANKAHDVISGQAQAKVHTLVQEVRDYLKAGDTSKPFAASDLAEGKLATALTYADELAKFDADAAAKDVVEPVEEENAKQDAPAEGSADSKKADETRSVPAGVIGVIIAVVVAIAGFVVYRGRNKE